MGKAQVSATPSKVAVNWRVDRRALDLAKAMVVEQGYSSLPALINSMLIKIGTNPEIKRIVFGG